MEYRNLDVTVISAEGLNDVNLLSKMHVYVVASISGVQKMTNVDRRGGTSPKWNHHMIFSVAESAVHQPHLCLLFQLRSDRVLGDKDIGYVSVPLRDLLAGNTASERLVEYQVKKPSGKAKGTLKFSYKFDGKFAPLPTAVPQKAHEPVTAYPPHVDPSNTGSAYPPYGGASTAGVAAPGKGQGPVTAYPPHIGANTAGAPPAGVGMAYNPPPAYAYPPPPQHAAGYGYPPPTQAYPAMAGYGYPQQAQKPKKNKNKLGLGLGAGLLGGLLVGDMLSDVGDMSAYDGGFDDSGFDGGFDF